jgi:ribosomal protein L7Ae-like RNA K-turn-binding protein
MLNSKLTGYLGFAAKARKLQTGYNTCLSLIERRKVRLLIVAEDSSPNTIKKMTQKCESSGTDCRIFGSKDELSKVTGGSGNGIFAITDGNFAKVIKEEIDRDQSEGEVF